MSNNTINNNLNFPFNCIQQPQFYQQQQPQYPQYHQYQPPQYPSFNPNFQPQPQPQQPTFPINPNYNQHVGQLTVSVENNSTLRFHNPTRPTDSISMTFHRTLRIPDDGKIYPLPPSLGTFPIKKVDDYLHKVPESWKKQGGVFIPLLQREAMWIKFNNGSDQYPHAVKVAVGKINALSGESWDEDMKKRNVQDYCVAPKQPWIDGINAGNGFIKQFVAMPLGSGYTVEHQVSGEEKFGGIQIVCYNSVEEERLKKFRPKPKPTVFFNSYNYNGNSNQIKFKKQEESKKSSALYSNNYCDQMECCNDESDTFCLPPSMPMPRSSLSSSSSSSSSLQRSKVVASSAPKKAQEMGLAAGGKIKQQIVEDNYGPEFWNVLSKARVFVHIVNSEMYEQITGEKAPPSSITAQTYNNHKYPWFDYYDENYSSVGKSNILSNVKTVKQIDQKKHVWPKEDNSTVYVKKVQTIKPQNLHGNVRDGDW